MLGQKRIPSREGGVEIVVEELSTRMAALGHQVTCYNRSGHHVSGRQYDEKKPLREYKGVQIRTVPTINRRGLAAMTSSTFGAFLSALGKYDVVHFHAEGPCSMLWMPKITGKRCIATIHGLDHQRAKWGAFASRYILFGERMAVKNADEIIVLSRNVQEYFRKTYGRETHYIPNGVNRPVPRKASRITKKWDLTKDGYLLYVGRLVPEKGLRYLIEAFRQVKTDKRLVITGGTSDTNDFVHEIRQMAAGDERILFTGFRKGKMLEELYSNAWAYVLPTDLEGMPLTLLEAMSYGNCCVTSDIPECTEVMEDKGLTFPKGDVQALAALLQRICDEPQIVEDCRRDAADFICAKYNWDDVVKKTLALYYGDPVDD